jgi:hypothetical protein
MTTSLFPGDVFPDFELPDHRKQSYRTVQPGTGVRFEVVEHPNIDPTTSNSVPRGMTTRRHSA